MLGGLAVLGAAALLPRGPWSRSLLVRMLVGVFRFDRELPEWLPRYSKVAHERVIRFGTCWKPVIICKMALRRKEFLQWKERS